MQKKHMIVATTLILLQIMMIFSSLKNSAGFEPETTTKLSLEQSSDNFEMIGSLASTISYDYFDIPKISGNDLIHEITRLNVTRIQKTNYDSSTIATLNSQTSSTEISNSITEFVNSAPFDASFKANIDLEIDESLKDYAEDSEIEIGSVNSGTLDDTHASDDSAYAIDSNIRPKQFPTWVGDYNAEISSGNVDYISEANDNEEIILTNPRCLDDSSFNVYYETPTPSTFKIKIRVGYNGDFGQMWISLVWNEYGNAIVNAYDTSFSGFQYRDITVTINAGTKTVNRILMGLDYIETMYFDYVALESPYESETKITIDNTEESQAETLLRVKSLLPVETFTVNDVSYTISHEEYTDLEIPTCISITIDLFSQLSYEENILYIDYVAFQPVFQPISTVSVDLIYLVNAIPVSETITASLFSKTQTDTTFSLVYVFDSSQFEQYDYINDITFEAQDFTYNIAYNSAFVGTFTTDIAVFTEFSSSEWTVPSEIHMKLNGNTIVDESYNSGYIELTEYPISLDFEADIENIIFNFSLTSFFSYETDLTIISSSYFRETLSLSSFHSLEITQVEYLFESSIKHSYLNNIDYDNDKIFFPRLTWLKSSNLKIEVLLNDQAYLELEKVNLFDDSTSLLEILAQSNTLSYYNQIATTKTITIPTNFNILNYLVEFDNIRYTEPYSHVENNTYNISEESQSRPNFSYSQTNNQSSYTNTTKPNDVYYQQTQNSINSSCVITNSSENFDYYNVCSKTISESIEAKNSNYNADYQNTIGIVADNSWVVRESYTPSTWNDNVDVDGHTSVIQLTKTSSSIGIKTSAIPDANNIIVDFWLRCTDASKEVSISIVNSWNGNLGGCGFYGGKMALINYAGWLQTTTSVSANTWYHFNINWTRNSYQYVYLNDNFLASQATNNDVVSKLHYLVYATNTAYLDAIGCTTLGYINGTNKGSNSINKTISLGIEDVQIDTIKNFSIITNHNISSIPIILSATNRITNQSQIINSTFANSHIQSIYAQNYFNQTNSKVEINVTFFYSTRNISMTFSFIESTISFQIYYYNSSRSQISPNLVISYNSKVQVGQINNISIQVQKTISDISKIIYWDNITNTNTTLGTTEGQYSKTIILSTSQYYNFSVFVNDSVNSWKKVYISNVFVAKNQSNIQLSMPSKSTFSELNPTELTNNVIADRNFSIYRPNGQLLISMIYHDSINYFTYVSFSQYLSLTKQMIEFIHPDYQYGNYSTQEVYGWWKIRYSSIENAQYLESYQECFIEIFPDPAPIVSVVFQNKLQLGDTNTITIQYNAKTEDLSGYDSNYVEYPSFYQFYENATGTTISGNANSDTNIELNGTIIKSITLNISQLYNFSFYIQNRGNVWTKINASYIFVAKNSSQFMIRNLYQQYYQNSTININTTSDKAIQFKIYKPDGSLLNSSINNSITPIYFNHTGYYLVNATFVGTNQYLGYSIETVFELLPIERIRTQIDVELDCSRISNNFVFTSIPGTTFNTNITLSLVYNTTIANSEISIFTFQFNATQDISSIFTQNVSLANYRNFTSLIITGQLSSNYSYFNNSLYLNDFNNTLYTNKDSFNFAFSYTADSYLRQLDSHITTNDESIRFREYGLSTKNFTNWFIESNYDVNSVSIQHISSQTNPTIANENDYYYFTQINTKINDLFEITWNIDPNFEVSYETLSNNGTHINVKVRVSSDITVDNISVIFTPTFFYNTWSNATQNSLTNQISFYIEKLYSGTTVFYLTGSRPVPIANLIYFTSQNGISLTQDFTSGVTYAGILQYSDYSEVWGLNVSNSWELDGIHYGNITHVIQNNTFFCSGYDSSITSSYLQFRANPLNSFEVDVSETQITLTINMNLPLNNCILEFYSEKIEGNFKVKTEGCSKLTDYENLTLFSYTNMITLNQGQNIIVIEYEKYSLNNSWYYTLPIVLIAIGGIVWYFYAQRKTPKNQTKGDKK